MRSILRNAVAIKLVVGSLAIALTGCGGFGGSGGAGGSVVPPSVTTPTQIALSSGENQSALKGTALPNPLVVLVTDAKGGPVSGVNVTFAVGSGGGSLSTTTATTDSLGQARSILTVGPSAGANTVTASANGSASQPLNGSPVTFHATATDTPPPPPPPPVAITYVTDVAPVLAAKCTSCHAPGMSSAGEPLDTYAAVTQGTSKFGYTPAAYVVAGQPAQSLLLVKCASPSASQGGKMPPASSLTAAELQTVNDWIAGGALYQSTGGGATQIQKTSGDAQTATAGGMLANPFVVTVLDAQSKPVQGVSVTWAITAGNGSLSASSSTTDSAGQAKATLTTGLVAGTNTVTASSSGLSGSPITFTATGNPGPASKLALVSGDAQTGLVGKPLANPLAVKVTDMAGNGIAGFNVTFAVTAGGGTLSATTVASNGLGVAQTTLTLGAVAGANKVTASGTGLSGSPIFTETGNVGAAASLAIVSGNNQTGVAGSALGAPLVVVAKDASGNGVPGVSVAFAVATGGGTLSAATATTGANGQAQVGYTLGKTAGANKVTATVTGLTAVSFASTGNPGPASVIAKISGDNQTQTAGTTLAQPLVVAVRDANGNAVPNTAIAFAVTTGAGTLSAVSTMTNASGQAQATYKLGATAATNTVTVSKTGLTSVVFTETGTAATAPTMSIVSGNNQTGAVGATLPNPLVIAIKDSTGAAVANKAVTFAVVSGGGTLSSVSAMTDATGQAKATLKLGTTAGANTVSCSAVGVNMSPQTFTATATAGAAAKLVKFSGDAQSGTAGSALANPIVVEVVDAASNPVKGVTVSFTTTSGTLSAASGVSDAAGKVSVSLTLSKTAGSVTVTAASTGLTSVAFAETGKAGAAASIAIASGDAQSGSVSTALANPLMVVVKDANANLVQGATVTFAVTMGGGSLSATTATTAANGQASTVLTLGATAGTNKVSATVGTLTPVVFTETGTAVTTSYYYTTDIQPLFAAHCTVCHSPTGTLPAAPLDTYAALTTGSTKYSYTPAKYVVAGSAATSLVDAKLHGTAGGGNMATQGSLTAAQVQIVRDWINQGAKQSSAGAPATVAKSAGDAQSGPVGSTLPVKLTVVVKDASGNPVPGVAVAFSVVSGGGSLAAASANTDAAGLAGVSYTLGATAGANSVKATVGALTPVTFTETGTASSYSGAPLTGSTNVIDVEALKVLKAGNVEPAALSSDQEFIRRVYADLAGRLPSESEMQTFVASTSASKRATTIDSLLASTDFSNHWANDIFANWACISTSTASVVEFNKATAAEIQADRPMSTMVKNLIEGTGPTTAINDFAGNPLQWGDIWLSTFRNYGDTQQIDQLMETFAGQSAQCGRCHDHKLTVTGQDDPMWTQDDVYGLYAYVANSAGAATKVTISGSRFGSTVPAHFVADGYASKVDSFVPGTTTPMTAGNTPIATRRAALAGIFATSRAFTRGTAHRIFAEVMDPLLEPNQFLAANLAAVKQPGILAALEQQFKMGNYSLKSLLRLICNSKLYQLTTAGTTTKNDSILARRTVRRHHSEVIEKGLYSVTGVTFTATNANWEQQFGYPLRHQDILDRNDAVNIGQAFMLLNSPIATNGLVKKTNSRPQTLANQVTAGTITMNQAITTIFHEALGRDPSSTELTAINTAIAGQTPLVALEDVSVAICNSSEFVSR